MLPGGNEAVGHQRCGSGDRKPPRTMLAHGLPDEPAATDFGQPGQDEQRDRAGHHHHFSLRARRGGSVRTGLVLGVPAWFKLESRVFEVEMPAQTVL